MQEIDDYFSKFGELESVVVSRQNLKENPSKCNPAQAFVLYRYFSDAVKAAG